MMTKQSRGAALTAAAVAIALPVLSMVPAHAAPVVEHAQVAGSTCDTRSFTGRLRSGELNYGVALTHAGVVRLDPGESATDLPWIWAQEFTASATIDEVSRPRLGNRLIRRAAHRSGRRLKPVGATTDRGPVPPTALITNDGDAEDLFVAYRGTVTVNAYVQRSVCVPAAGTGGRKGTVRWNRVGRWWSYLKIVQGVGSCNQPSDGRVESYAVMGFCR